MATVEVEENDIEHSKEITDDEFTIYEIANFEYSQEMQDILLEVLAIQEINTIKLKLRMAVKKSNDTVLTRILKSIKYIFTGKFDTECVLSLVGISEINNFLNSTKSVIASVKRQSDKWRWNF